MPSINFNFKKLQGRIVEKGYTANKCSASIGISPTTFSKKISNKAQFTASEIAALVALLEIPKEEIGSYFFGQ